MGHDARDQDHGEVAHFNGEFGFIAGDRGGEDVFFHANYLPDNVRSRIFAGVRVVFVAEIAKNGKGMRARYVQLEKE